MLEILRERLTSFDLSQKPAFKKSVFGTEEMRKFNKL